MVETISPVGYGDRRGAWLAAVALHTLGATAAAAAFGALLGTVGSLVGASLGPAGTGLVGVTAAVYAAREAFGLPVPVPAGRRQVPDWWRSFFAWPAAAVLYGAGLGIGFFTYLANGGLVVVAIAAVAGGRPATGALLMGAFGLARGLSALVAWPVRSSAAGTTLVDRLASADPRGRRWLNAGALALVVLAVVGALPRALEVASTGAIRTGLAAVAAGVVAGTFAWAAVAKLVDRRGWRRTLTGYGLSPAVRRGAELGIPPAELGVPVAALLGSPRVAASLALILLGLFSIAIVRARVVGGRRAIACGCSGGARTRDFRLLLGRNAVLAVAAWACMRTQASAFLHWPGAPEQDGLLPFMLALLGGLVGLSTAWRSMAWLSRGRRA